MHFVKDVIGFECLCEAGTMKVKLLCPKNPSRINKRAPLSHGGLAIIIVFSWTRVLVKDRSKNEKQLI